MKPATSARTEPSEISDKVRQIEIRTKRLVEESLAGQYHSVFRGRGMDFDEVREYVPGDDVRAIDWNVTAREGRPFIKKFREERELTLMLVIDVSRSFEFGSKAKTKLELAAEIASVLAFSATLNNDKVGLVLFGDEIERYIPAKTGRAHVLRVVREILAAEPRARGTDFSAALRFVGDVRHQRSIVFLMSDFESAREVAGGYRELKDALRLTRKRHDVVAVALHDPLERALPNVGTVIFEDAETGELIELDTASRRTRERYAEAAQQRASTLQKVLRAEAIDQLTLATDGAYLPELIRFFRQRDRSRN